jgi:hypothetical protein
VWRLLIAVLALLTAGPASAADVVVWLEVGVPGPAARNAVERAVGDAVHLDGAQLAWPSSTPAIDAELRIRALAAAQELSHSPSAQPAAAAELGALADGVKALRSPRDAAIMLRSRLLQGQAEWRVAPGASAWDGGVPDGWRDAVVLAGPDAPVALELLQAEAVPAFEAARASVLAGEPALIELGVPPAGTTWRLDGREVDVGSHPVYPGRHFVLAGRGSDLFGARAFEVAPGEVVEIGPPVGADEVAVARARVLLSSTVGFPESVKQALQRVAAEWEAPVFVAAYDGERTVVLPYARGAVLRGGDAWSLDVIVEVGPAIEVSSLLDGGAGLAPSVDAGIGLEAESGWLVLLGAVDFVWLTSSGITRPVEAGGEGGGAAVLLRPYAGAGVAVLRGDRPFSLSVLGTVGWNAPAHAGYGGRLVGGLRVGGASALRICVGASGSPASTWDAVLGGGPRPQVHGLARVGVDLAL